MALANFDNRYCADAEEEEGLRERLELFQAFTQIYNRHRDWLKRLVNLDQDALQALAPASMHYIQGIVSAEQVYLVSNLTHGYSQSIAATDRFWTLGRDPRQSNLAVLDRRLSRCHAKIRYCSHQGFVLADADSTNGTFVNGDAVVDEQVLRDGDQVRLGSLTFFFFTDSATETSVNPDSVPSTGMPLGDTTLRLP
ncbi:MAG: FHA domain-containing protein [Cyanobacteria bacterium J06554_6]